MHLEIKACSKRASLISDLRLSILVGELVYRNPYSKNTSELN